jgi:SAM-dependent methyltransferase
MAALRAFSPKRARYRLAKARADAAFDARHGTDTAGVTHLETLDTLGPYRSVGTVHLASPREEFDAAIALVDLSLEQLTFVDLGSGKGRAVLLAAERPLARIIGVEFAREFHEVALRNIAAGGRGDSRIELVRADAATYPLPDGPLLIFLFNPFGPPVIDLVAQHALESWQASPRPVRILYMNPIHLDAIVAAGWRAVRIENGAALLAPAAS